MTKTWLSFLKKIIDICYVQAHDSLGDAKESRSEENRRKKANEFIEFFEPPWCGVMTHVCRDGCCTDRIASVNKGTDLIMTVIFPRMTEPSANRYTKIFPAVLQNTLAMNFFTLTKRVILRLLKGVATGSDDDAEVLHDEAAIVGAPADAIVHMRKVQAPALL